MSVDEWIKKIWVCACVHACVYIYTQSIIQPREKRNLPFAATWMDLEGIILVEIKLAH